MSGPGHVKTTAQRLAIAGALMATVALGASACGDSEAAPSDSKTIVVTKTASPSPESNPEAGAESTPAENSVGEDGASANGAYFSMPNEVGKVLQVAQDDLQARSGNPFFYTDSVDATPADRFQALDSGWQVCSQSKAPGQRVSVDDTSIVFKVVRVEESCP